MHRISVKCAKFSQYGYFPPVVPARVVGKSKYFKTYTKIPKTVYILIRQQPLFITNYIF